MKLKHKISLLVIGILLVVSLLISSSYALWVFNVSQESTNVLVSDCFEITFTEGSQAINLTNSFPMKDSKGVYTTPYEFTLKNICNHAADISINLETLNNSEVAGENLRVDVNGHIHTYGDNNIVEPTLDNASSASSFYNDTIAAGKSKSYNLRLWIREDADSNDVLNKKLSSKITVKSTAKKDYSEATLVNGRAFISIIKTLTGDNNPDYNTTNEKIISIQRSANAPLESNNVTVVSTEDSDKPIYAWFDNGTIFIYSEATKIYMNNDSSFLFSYLTKITSIDLSYFDTSKVTSMWSMFQACYNLKSLDLSSFDTSNVTSMSRMFYNMNSVHQLDVSVFNTENVIDMSEMFSRNLMLENINLSHFNTSKVENMSEMFSEIKNIQELDVTNFNTSNVEDMSGMFGSMTALKRIDVSNFDTSKVKNFGGMFESLIEIESLDVANFDTSNAENMSGMFARLSSLSELDLSGFDTSKVTNMSGMFYYNSNLERVNLSSFNTTNVKYMGIMFAECKKIKELDLSSFDLSNVYNMRNGSYSTGSNGAFLSEQHGMFENMISLTTIYVGNNWNAENATYSDGLFKNCPLLVGGSGTTYDANHIDKEYARIDDPDNGKPGYLTLKEN